MAMEPNLNALWINKQTAKGTTAAAASAKRGVWVAGDVNVARDDGSENFSTLDRWGDQVSFVNTIVGEGSPGIQGRPDIAAYLAYLFFGQETVTGAADPWSHEATPGTAGFWATVWKRIGGSIIERQLYGDSKISGIQWEGSTASKVLRITPTILSLNPGEIFAADPAAAMPTGAGEMPFLYTEGQGAFEIDGTVIPGQSQFTVNCDEALGPYYGDDVVPVDLVVGNPTITVAVTLLVDAAGVAQYNTRVYGSATPAAGTKPLHFLDPIGSYEFLLTRKNSAGPITPARSFKLELPGVQWAPDVALPPNNEGGAMELSLAGEARLVTGQPRIRVTVQNGVAAYT
jgi:hypothetical protein